MTPVIGEVLGDRVLRRVREVQRHHESRRTPPSTSDERSPAAEKLTRRRVPRQGRAVPRRREERPSPHREQAMRRRRNPRRRGIRNERCASRHRLWIRTFRRVTSPTYRRPPPAREVRRKVVTVGGRRGRRRRRPWLSTIETPISQSPRPSVDVRLTDASRGPMFRTEQLINPAGPRGSARRPRKRASIFLPPRSWWRRPPSP